MLLNLFLDCIYSKCEYSSYYLLFPFIMTSKGKRMRDPCFVCGDKSIGYNFGVLTCMACKAFFRRNAVKLGVKYFNNFNIFEKRINLF